MDKIIYLLKRIYGIVVNSFMDSKRRYKLRKSDRILKKLKNSHSGERCFIIGNGPSLRIEDLEKLKKEICFSSHRIYKIFNKTDWRPTYYCAQDSKLISQSSDDINNLGLKKKFIAYFKNETVDIINKAVFINMMLDSFTEEGPKFSDDLTNGVYEGFTVTYMCIQMAVYMGFKTIYLLGMDHQYSIELSEDGSIINNKVQDHFDASDMIANIPQPYKAEMAYKSALNYCNRHGVSIINVSRGGKLEVFLRKNFDDIVK